MDLDECFKKGLIKETYKDTDLILSLIKMSDIKEYAVRTAKIDEKNISAYVSLAYDSLRELLESLCVYKGYKVLSHICMGFLLKDILDDFDYDSFDRLRWIRNSINYYGETVSLNEGKEFIEKTFKIKKNIFEKYLKQLE